MDVHFGGGELAVVGALLAATTGALTVIFKLLMKSKDDALIDVKSERDNYKSVAVDLNRVLQVAIAENRTLKGISGPATLAAVKAEHQSPVKEAALTTAIQATLRASSEAAALELGVPGRASDVQISKTDAIAAVLALPESKPVIVQAEETASNLDQKAGPPNP